MDAEFSNLRSGINVEFSGTRGTDFAEEYFLHDKTACDRKVVYIKSATQISMVLTARALGRKEKDGIPRYCVIGTNGEKNDGATGKRRYRIDGDLNWGDTWSSVKPGTNPQYTTPLTFAALTYPSNTPVSGQSVLGATGNNGVAVTSKTGHWNYGSLDAAGNELHTLQFCSDHADWYMSGYMPPGGIVGETYYDDEWICADGGLLHFIVNPKTPCLTFRASGAGQFYTTPLKRYHLPQVMAQTTYFQGTISLEIRNIMGGNVFYRVGGGSYIDAGASFVTLTDANFADGSNTLQYYYAGNAAYTATRTIVKNPAFPSAGETHGLLLFGTQGALDDFGANEADGLGTTGLNGIWYKKYVTGEGQCGSRVKWASIKGLGTRDILSQATGNALVAKFEGVTAAQSGQQPYAVIAKEMIMENVRRIDPIGVHMAHGQTQLPCRDIIYRGYYDNVPMNDLLFAYDFLISFYKSTDATGGITPIEDYFIRDSIADFVFEAICQKASIHDVGTDPQVGMWQCARACTAALGALVLPKYSTPYYGTSGCDNATTTTFTNCPFPSDQYTWKKVLIDDDGTLVGYPNLSKRLGIEGDNCASGGVFTDKTSYWSHMGKAMGVAASIIRRAYPLKTYPNFELCLVKGWQGTLYGQKSVNGSLGPAYVPILPACNASFPNCASVAVPIVMAVDPNSDSHQLRKDASNFPITQALFDEDWVSPTECAPPAANKTAGAYEAAITVTLTCATSGASMYYTTNGATPTSGSTLYTVPVALASSATLKVIAIKSGLPDSVVLSRAYTIDTSGKPAPVLNPRVTAA